MRKYAGILLNQAGLPQAQSLIRVVQTGTQVSVPIFDKQMKQISNPVTTDDGGQYAFWVRSGVYDLLDDATAEILAEAIQIFDFTNPGEWLGIWDFPKLGITFGGPGPRNLYALTDTRMATDSAMRVGGSQSLTDPAFVIVGGGGQIPLLQAFQTIADAEAMWTFDSLGKMSVGAGAAIPPDVNLYRSAANEWTTDDAFVVKDRLQHQGTLLSFYGAPAIAQPVINAGTITLPANQALYDLFIALAKLGIVSVNYTIVSSGSLTVNVDMTATRFVNGLADNQCDVIMSSVATVA